MGDKDLFYRPSLINFDAHSLLNSDWGSPPRRRTTLEGSSQTSPGREGERTKGPRTKDCLSRADPSPLNPPGGTSRRSTFRVRGLWYWRGVKVTLVTPLVWVSAEGRREGRGEIDVNRRGRCRSLLGRFLIGDPTFCLLFGLCILVPCR